MRIVIFSGTTEGRELSARLAERGDRVLVCVATAYGEEEQGTVPGVEKHTGRMDAEEMAEVLSGADLCIDATHPYAERVTKNLRGVCLRAGVDYLRLLRPAEDRNAADAVTVGSAAEAARYLMSREGRILLTTGVKELNDFVILEPERLYPRILPTAEGIEACEKMGIPHRNILALQGPFSEELNEAILRQYGIRYLVTKDGGTPGGFPEKVSAARKTGAILILIRRPEDSGSTFEEILSEIEERRKPGPESEP